jgi:hypothetical protein
LRFPDDSIEEWPSASVLLYLLLLYLLLLYLLLCGNCIDIGGFN